LRDLLASDAEYARAGSPILDAPLSDPPFVRVESSLLRAFDAMPTLEPSAAAGSATPRIYEMRTYESHSDRAALNKLKMFDAGEVPIFRRAGSRSRRTLSIVTTCRRSRTSSCGRLAIPKSEPPALDSGSGVAPGHYGKTAIRLRIAKVTRRQWQHCP